MTPRLCRIKNAVGYGGVLILYSTEPGCHNNKIVGNSMLSCNYGVFIKDSVKNTLISGNLIKNSTYGGIQGFAYNYGTTITGNTIINFGTYYGIKLDRTYDVQYDSIIISGNYIEDDGSNYGIYIDAGSGINVTGNTIKIPDGHCIYLNSSPSNLISSNLCLGDGNGDSSDDGIYLTGDDSDKNIIVSNHIRNKDRYGINISTSTAELNLLANNHFDSLGNSEINDLSSNTIYASQILNSNLILNSTSSLGVGTTTPSGKLHVFSNSTTTIIFDSSTQGACLKLKDSDGSGYTYCTANNGTLSCTTTPCE